MATLLDGPHAGAKVYVVAEDLVERGIAAQRCVPEAEPLSRADLLDLLEAHDQIWHCYLPDVRPGQLYGYRVYGPYRPGEGHRFNPAQLLIDPYAKAISGTIKWSNALFAYKVGGPREDLEMSTENSAGGIESLQLEIRDAAPSGHHAEARAILEETEIADLLDLGVLAQIFADLGGILSGAGHPQLQRLERTEQHPGGVGITDAAHRVA